MGRVVLEPDGRRSDRHVSPRTRPAPFGAMTPRVRNGCHRAVPIRAAATSTPDANRPLTMTTRTSLPTSRSFRFMGHSPARPARAALLAFAAIASTFIATSRAGAAETSNVDLPRMPSVSPDGSSIIFTWHGDLWRVDSRGGEAVRLTAHRANDLGSAWSRDGQWIAFESDRDGAFNIYVMRPDGTELRQVTYGDQNLSLGGFAGTADEPTITFAAGLEPDLYRSPRVFEVSMEGGQPRRLHDAFGSEAIVSPDGTRVIFTRGGSSWNRRHYRGPDDRDVWLYNRSDKSFRQLTTWTGNDGKARWKDDATILFMSDREGDTVNVFEMNVDQGEPSVRPLTSFRGRDVVDFDISADGRTLIAHVWDALHRVDLGQGRSSALRITAGEDEGDRIDVRDVGRSVSEAKLSPDGKTLAVIAYGDIYVRSTDDKAPTRAITRSEAREYDLAWSPDGLRLYFTSDMDGTESIYVAEVAATRKELREEARRATGAVEPAPEPGPKPEPDVNAEEEAPDASAADGESKGDAGADGGAANDTPAERPAPGAAGPRGSRTKKPVDPKFDPTRWQDAVRFNVTPLIQTPNHDHDPSPSPDGRLLAFRRGPGVLMILDLENGTERVLVDGWDAGLEWRWSPDSRWIAYAQEDRNFNSDIFIVPADGSAEPVNITRHPDNDIRPRWSADGRILAFSSERTNEEYDVWAVYLDKSLEAKTPLELERYFKDAVAAAKKRKPLKPIGAPETAESDEPGAGRERPGRGGRRGGGDGGDGDASGDGAGRNGDSGDEGASTTESKMPAKLDLDDAWKRVRRITRNRGNESSVEITPGGDRFIFSAVDNEPGLYSVKWDGTEQKRIGSGDLQQVTLTGDRIVTVANGRATTLRPEGGESKTIDINATVRIDRQELSARKFRELARVLGELFYHPTMKDLDWPALTDQYLVLAENASTPEEFNFVANRFLGELNASHLGVRAPETPSPIRQSLGRLGATVERIDIGDAIEFRVTAILPESPAALSTPPLQVGDVITAIEFEPFTKTDTVETRLRGRVGQETAITVRRQINGAAGDQGDGRGIGAEDFETGIGASPDGADADAGAGAAANAGAAGADDAIAAREATFTVLVTPVSFERIRSLAYDAYQEEARRRVAELSDGRIGYIHIRAMNQSSLDEFERDLYAAAHGRDGLIIDVRNNGGGSTADLLLASIMVQPHAYTVPRGADPEMRSGYPQDRLFIQRYTLPINMLCNEKSFSNAEIISHAFKTLKRGTLVGQQTYGGVISTGGFTLLDGTTVRLPFRGWYLLDGTDMENNGAMPDILVEQTPEAESANADEQLEAAVRDLMQRL